MKFFYSKPNPYIYTYIYICISKEREKREKKILTAYQKMGDEPGLENNSTRYKLWNILNRIDIHCGTFSLADSEWSNLICMFTNPSAQVGCDTKSILSMV